MGQESPIEPWLAPDNRAACESPNRPASLRQNDENRWQRKPKALREGSSVPRSRNGRPKQSCSTGWAGRQEKLRPKEKSFFLDSFYRTYQALQSGIVANRLALRPGLLENRLMQLPSGQDSGTNMAVPVS